MLVALLKTARMAYMHALGCEQEGIQERAKPSQLAACKDTSKQQTWNAVCTRLSIVRLATGPKRSMGHVPGAEKGNFLIRGRGRPPVNGGRTIGILSIRGPEISLGSLRVAPIHG